MKVKASELYRLTALGQSVFYVATGVWSLVGIKSFQKVTGPKTDVWLVKTVGALVIVIGSVLGMAGARRAESPEIAVLGVGSAAALAAIDVVYVSRKRISPIYLLDAVAEGGLIAMWAAGWKLISNRRALESEK
jgi:hypothetical protein